MTKKADKERCSSILNSYQLEQIITGDDHDFLMSVIGRHPEAAHKIGTGVSCFLVRENPVYKNRGFWLTRTDGSQTDFSFIKAIDGDMPHRSEVLAALRSAIQAQIIGFRDFRLTVDPRCAITGEFVTADTADVDHNNPEFIQLADMFAATAGGYGQIKIAPNADGDIGYRLNDPNATFRWQRFHQEQANLRLVAKASHRSKRGPVRPKHGQIKTVTHHTEGEVTMTSPFQQPAQGGDKVPMQELIGALVLIKVTDYRTEIVTSFGDKDAVACDVHVLDGKHGGEVFDNALLFQGALIGSLKPAVGGQPVLARVGQGVAKPGQNAPFVLNPFTDADAALAGPYWAAVQAKAFQAPAAAAPDPWAAQQAAAAAVPTSAQGAVSSTPAATPAVSSAATPAANGMTAAAFSALPPQVQELLRQSGQVPAA